MRVPRIFRHTLRYRSDLIYSSVISTLMVIIYAPFYPGEEAIKQMFNIFTDTGLSGIFTKFDINSPGWILWLLLLVGLILFYVLAISGINIGSKIVPSVENDAVEVFMGSNPITPRRFYFENYLAAILIQIMIITPSFVLIGIFTIFVHDSADAMPEVALAFLISLSLGMFFLSLSSMASILRFSKSFGKAVGFGYLAFAFIISILADSPDYIEYSNLSINNYVNPIGAIMGEFKWEPFFVVLGISLALFSVGLWRVKYPEFIEKVGSNKKSFGIGNPLSFVVAPNSFMGRKFPIFTDQMRKDMKATFIMLFLIIMQQYALFTALPSTDQLATVLAQSNSPMLSAFSQNHPLQESFLGFLILKFYSGLWIYFGLLIAFIAAAIPNRDVRTDTHDIIFANNISPIRFIFSRTLSMVVTLSILVWVTFPILRIFQSNNVNIDIDFQLQLGVFTAIWLHYLGMGILLIGVAMIPLVNKGRNMAMMTFVFFILMSFIPFLNESIEFLKYASYLSYFDPVGMMYGEVSISSSILTSSIMLVGSIIFTAIMTKMKYAKTDLR